MAYFFREIFYETVGTLQRCTFFAVDGPRCMQIFLAHAMTCILAIFMAIFCMHEIRPKKPFSGHIAGFFIDPLDILRLSYFQKLTLVLVKKKQQRLIEKVNVITYLIKFPCNDIETRTVWNLFTSCTSIFDFLPMSSKSNQMGGISFMAMHKYTLTLPLL